MNWMEAAGWGIAGGLAAGLVMLMTAVTAADFKWPWKRVEIWPRLFVIGCGLIVGAIVAAAAHAQMSGGWPAFVMGAGAPATIRGLLSGVEVHPKLGPPADRGESRTHARETISEGTGQ
jgi:hypothetical protein